MVRRRRQPDWYELADGTLFGERRIGRLDAQGRLTAEKCTGHKADAAREEHVYEAMPYDPRKRERRRARWVRGR
jgi:hypothetical protein